jgi:hypothetical protein
MTGEIYAPPSGDVNGVSSSQLKDAAAIVASNFRAIDKGAVRGSVDLVIVKWRVKFKGCLWCESNGRQWITLPSSKWVDRGGKAQFLDAIEFTDRGVKARFQDSALAAVYALIGHIQQ